MLGPSGLCPENFSEAGGGGEGAGGVGVPSNKAQAAEHPWARLGASQSLGKRARRGRTLEGSTRSMAPPSPTWAARPRGQSAPGLRAWRAALLSAEPCASQGQRRVRGSEPLSSQLTAFGGGGTASPEDAGWHGGSAQTQACRVLQAPGAPRPRPEAGRAPSPTCPARWAAALPSTARSILGPPTRAAFPVPQRPASPGVSGAAKQTKAGEPDQSQARTKAGTSVRP